MSNKYLDILEGTDYKVEVCRDDDGDPVISLTKDVFGTEGYVVDYDLLASEIMFGGVTETAIRSFAQREIQKDKQAENLYGVYTGHKETD